MLKITQAEITRSGGFLGALTSVSTGYVNGILKPYIKWKSQDSADRFIVHKAPHLDEYLGEMFFRASLNHSERRRQFIEMALHAVDDSTAKAYWPSSAVFGMGADLKCGDYALHKFDEHYRQGGRKMDSCAALVIDSCFTHLPVSVQKIVDEVNIIDSSGGAHELHLNNVLKTSHQVLYNFGTNTSGRRMSGKLDDAWKRAVVNGMLAAVLYALEHGLDIESPDVIKVHSISLLDRYSGTSPYRHLEYYDASLQRLRNTCANAKLLLNRATLEKDGYSIPQLLVLPKISAAACQAWGQEIAYFLLSHFWESELLKNIHYSRVHAQIEKSFEHRPPKPVHSHDLSLYTIIVTQKKFLGAKSVAGQTRQAQYPSNLWLLGCRHGNAILQPNKAMSSFITENNFGVGLVLSENTREGTKVLFKGKHLPADFWDNLVETIQTNEPGLWFRPSDTAPFMVNGTQAHKYVDLSSLTLSGLAQMCREI